MLNSFLVNRRDMFSSTGYTNVHLCATVIKIFVAISRTQLCARFRFGPVWSERHQRHGYAPRPSAARRDVTGDGLPFRFEGFRSECLGHFQSKPKRGGWMGIESRPQRRTTANASVTQTRRKRVRPAPHTGGPFSSFVVGAIWQVLHNEWSRVRIPAASRLSNHKRIASAGNWANDPQRSADDSPGEKQRIITEAIEMIEEFSSYLIRWDLQIWKTKEVLLVICCFVFYFI